MNFNAIRALSTAFGSFRARMANTASVTYGGARNLYEALGYNRQPDLLAYRSRFMRNEIANRIVKMLPNATWRGGAEVWEDQDPNITTPFEEEFQALDD